MPIRTGSNAYLTIDWSASPTQWTIAVMARSYSTDGMYLGRFRNDTVNAAQSIYSDPNGSTLYDYTFTSAGGSSDSMASEQLALAGAAVAKIMLVRNGNAMTYFGPGFTSGRTYDPFAAGATSADLASFTKLVFGAWARMADVVSKLDEAICEGAAWTGAATAAEYAEYVANTKAELIGDSTFQATMFDVWDLAPAGASGAAVANGTTFTGLKNSNVLTLVGTTATVSSLSSPVSRTTTPVITGPTGAAGASSITTSAAENQSAAGTWTATNGVSWSLSGTDAADLSIAGGVVTKASGNFDYEAKLSYSFAVDNGSATQAVTLNITNASEPPLAPTIGTATAGNASASVAFTPPTNTGRPAITGYTATSSPGGLTGTGASSPVTVNGLTNGAAYTFTVTAANPDGTGPASAASNSVTPSAGGGGGDTTPPTLTGSITIGTVTSSSIQASWPAGSDNAAVTSYEVSSNGGTGYTDVGNVLTHTFSSLTASTSYALRVRAKDAAGNVSAPALAATQSTSAPGSTTYTAQTDIVAVSGIALASTLVYWTWFPAGRPGALTGPVNGTATTDSTGRATISHTVAGDGLVLIGTRPGPAASNDRVFAQFLALA